MSDTAANRPSLPTGWYYPTDAEAQGLLAELQRSCHQVICFSGERSRLSHIVSTKIMFCSAIETRVTDLQLST